MHHRIEVTGKKLSKRTISKLSQILRISVRLVFSILFGGRFVSILDISKHNATLNRGSKTNMRVDEQEVRIMNNIKNY